MRQACPYGEDVSRKELIKRVSTHATAAEIRVSQNPSFLLLCPSL